MKQKITARTIKSLKPGDLVRDTEVTGFLVQAGKTGASFKVQADLWVGARGHRTLQGTVRHTIAGTDQMSADEARAEARKVLAQIKSGIDPFAGTTNAPRRRAPKTDAPKKTWTVAEAYAAYVRTCGERTKADMLYRLAKYLSSWNDQLITAIDEHAVVARHRALVEAHGPHSANRSLRDFRAVYNKFATTFRRDQPPPNPVEAIGRKEWATETRRHQVIESEHLPAWKKRLDALPNALRRELHLLGLLSGLRPSNVVALERAWVDLDGQRVTFPKEAMKSRQPFVLPLSKPMVACLRKALAASEIAHHGSAHVFPARRRNGSWDSVQTWREVAMKNPTTGVQEVGYALRNTYAVEALKTPGVSYHDREMLMSHKLEGVGAVYTPAGPMFTTLLEKQELISGHILSLFEKK